MSPVLSPARSKFASLVTRLLLIVVALSGGLAHGDVIYRETFGRPSSPTTNMNPTVWGWAYFGLNGARVTTNTGVNGTDVGRPANVANVNAGLDSDGTLAAYTNGFAYSDQGTLSTYLTTEYTVNVASYNSGSINFSWYQGDAAIVSKARLLVRVGGNWYVGAQVFTNSTAVVLGTFQSASELKTVIYDPTAANWLTLNFDGSYDAATSTTVNSTKGSLAIGSAPGSDLSGDITGFGLYFDRNGGSGNTRFDSYTVQATPNGVAPPSIVASNQTVSLLYNTSTNIALMASNTNNTALTFYITNGPANGALGSLNSNLVIYTPNSNYVGGDSFAFYASDGVFTSAVATVSIAVTNTEILYPP